MVPKAERSTPRPATATEMSTNKIDRFMDATNDFAILAELSSVPLVETANKAAIEDGDRRITFYLRLLKSYGGLECPRKYPPPPP